MRPHTDAVSGSSWLPTLLISLFSNVATSAYITSDITLVRRCDVCRYGCFPASRKRQPSRSVREFRVTAAIASAIFDADLAVFQRPQISLFPASPQLLMKLFPSVRPWADIAIQ